MAGSDQEDKTQEDRENRCVSHTKMNYSETGLIVTTGLKPDQVHYSGDRL
jgi:hypothetical protein